MLFAYLHPKFRISSPIILQTRYVVCTNFVEIYFHWHLRNEREWFLSDGENSSFHF